MKFTTEEIEFIAYILSFLYIDKGVIGIKHGMKRFVLCLQISKPKI